MKLKDIEGLNRFKKERPNYIAYKKTRFSSKDTYSVKVKVQSKAFHANGIQKEARMAMLISEKINFK